MGPADARRLAIEAAPGARVTRVRRLRGGSARVVFAVDLAAPEGGRRVVVRSYGDDVAAARFEAAVLQHAERVGLPAPRLLVLSELPAATVMTRLPGRHGAHPPLQPWADGLAATLAQIHLASTDGGSFLPDHRVGLAMYLADGPRPALWADEDGQRVWSTLERSHPGLSAVQPALAHGDFWPGNVLWHRGRVSGVIDWDGAGLAEPGKDVGKCRAELAMLHGPHAADRFLAEYQRLVGTVVDLAFWDLLGAQGLLPDPERFLVPPVVGGAAASAESWNRRLRAFAADALGRVA